MDMLKQAFIPCVSGQACLPVLLAKNG